VDRDALVRAVRRRQALDALAFERDRAALLSEQLEETVALLDGQRIDADLYERLGSDDVQLVRAALRDGGTDDAGDDSDEDDENEFDPRAEAEAELARLQGELELSARTQAALERYLDVLAAISEGASAELAP
jgi:hypothetical protein